MKKNELIYTDFSEIRKLITDARRRAFKAVNSELINLYWEIGKYISEKIESSQWGNKTIDQLADFIKIKEPNIKGFERRNLYRMKQFYETYKDNEIVTPLVTQLPWTHNLIIFSRCKNSEERKFYLNLTVKEKYTKRELDRQINSGIFERTMLADVKLTTPLREIAPESKSIFRDSYVFEFLELPKVHSESDLKRALILYLKDFIIEIGRDFTFIGQEYRLQVGNSDFFIDLLFFHRELQCLVVFELKIDKFKPEYLGQLEFYLEALDRTVRKTHENPSIGILLCRDKDDEVVEFALNRSLSPALIAEYKTKLIPKEILRQKLNEFYEILEKKE
ncbi:MAG: DUF1016 family protein [Candidatus Cloacimonetes bacterium]|nr:DUF1016 family protein [Candidatus Cloacimonadota bacterium]